MWRACRAQPLRRSTERFAPIRPTPNARRLPLPTTHPTCATLPPLVRRALTTFALLAVGCAHPPPATAPAPSPPTETASTRPPPPPVPRPAYDLHVLDVGTGLSVLVTGPTWSLLYDAGSNDDLAAGGKNRVVAYLRKLRPSGGPIDHAILSHAHRDHVSLFADVFSAVGVKNVWEPGAVNDTCEYRQFLQAIADHPSVVYHSARLGPGQHEIDLGKETCVPKLSSKVSLSHGPKLEVGHAMALDRHATLTFLHVDPNVHGEDFNRTSVVVSLELAGTRVLLMGDGEAGGRADPSTPATPGSVEGRLLSTQRDKLRSDVLVVGHHGSKSSTRKAFLDAVLPQVAIVSAGPTKYHGVVLPDAEVMDLLRRQVREVYQTDVHDDACRRNAKKIGPDADGEAGGCDAVHVHFEAGEIRAAYFRDAD